MKKEISSQQRNPSPEEAKEALLKIQAILRRLPRRRMKPQLQNTCRPMVVMTGRDRIHWLVAVLGL